MLKVTTLALRRLVDDFPRQLSDFERTRIARELHDVLSKFPQSSFASKIPLSPPSIPSLPVNVETVLSSLDKWPTRLAVHNLHELLNADKSYSATVRKDERFLRLITCLDPKELATDVLVQLVSLLDPGSEKLVSILEELVDVREFEELTSDDLGVIIDAILPSSEATARFESPVMLHAKSMLDPQLFLRLVPLGLKKGEIIFPETLLPLFSKRESIDLLQQLEDCEFPTVIARTVAEVSDHLTRLSFRRLVSDEDRAELLYVLAKLKVKLDTMVFVEGNPFYDKSRHSFLRKIMGTLSEDFHHHAISLPITAASQRMLALSCVNKLRLESVDLIANRIAAFGDKLLGPSSVDPAVYTNIVYAMTRHPAGWKRRDRYRSLIGPQLARLLTSHMERMTDQQLISCAESSMRIHNKQIRAAVGQALVRLEPGNLSPTDLISALKISAVLLKHNEAYLTVDTVFRLMNAIPLEKLNTPQLVDVLDACREARLVSRANELVKTITSRLSQNGGLISPPNTVRVITAIGDLQLRDSTKALGILVECLPESSGLHPRLVSRLTSGLLLASIPNPECLQLIQLLIQQNLLSISIPERMQTVVEDRRTAGELGKSLKLSGSVGSEFMNHLSVLPVQSSDSAGVTEVDVTLGDLLVESIVEKPTISHEEWKGLLSPATALVEDIIGALVASPSDYLGGFKLRDPYSWEHREERILISVVRPKFCARDDPRRILGAMSREIALQRQDGWKVIVLPQQALDAALLVDKTEMKKRVRRAKILFQNVEDPYLKLHSQMKEILSSS